MSATARVSSLVLLVTACAPDLPRPAPKASSSPPSISVSTLPRGPAGTVPTIAQIELRGGPIDPATVILVAGEVSDEALRSLAQRSVPASTMARAVDAAIFTTDDDRIVIAPTAPLSAGTTYTVATGIPASRTSLVAEADDVPTWRRVFPTDDSASAFAVHCGDGSVERGVSWIGDVPRETMIAMTSGVPGRADFSGCVTVRSSGVASVPPALVSGARLVAHLAPTALDPGHASAIGALSCSPGALPIGVACAEVEDDRVRVDSAPGGFVVADLDGELQIGTTSIAFRGLSPQSPHLLAVDVVAPDGSEHSDTATILTAPARPHAVVNEALLAPFGAPATSQWIELYDDGEGDVTLDGWLLASGDRTVVLPAFTLTAQSFAIVVPESFDPRAPDVLPPASVIVVATPLFGPTGLAVTDEIRLLSPSRDVVSRLHFDGKTPRGQSIARERPDGDAVLVSTMPTPGAPNSF